MGVLTHGIQHDGIMVSDALMQVDGDDEHGSADINSGTESSDLSDSTSEGGSQSDSEEESAEHNDAHEHLTSATRKAPTSSVAVGFYQASMKLLVVVELLMGDIPDRSIFSQPKLERALEPYFKLVKAVRAGDLQNFLKLVHEYSKTFHADGTYTLILRLRH